MRFQSIVALTSLVSCAFALTGHNAVHEKAVMEVSPSVHAACLHVLTRCKEAPNPLWRKPRTHPRFHRQGRQEDQELNCLHQEDQDQSETYPAFSAARTN